MGLCYDMESLGACPKRMRSSEINGEELRGQPANPGSPGKMAVKTVFVSLTMLGLHTVLHFHTVT